MPEINQDYRKFLDPSVVSRLNSLELKAHLVVEGFIAGLHKSPYHGFSAEFSEHRPYMQGDVLKNIDWKAYAKTERFYVKQFEEETNLISHIIVDVSRSMDFSYNNSIKKLEYASILAASLMYLMIKQQDSVGLALYSDKIEALMPPKSNRAYLITLLKTLATSKPSSKTCTAECLNLLAEKVKKRGLIIIISDFFDDINSVLTALRHFRYKKNEVIVFQVLDPLERSFAFGRDAVFKDLETDDEIVAQPYQIQNAYQQAMNDYIQNIKQECVNSGIEYNLTDTSTPFDKALLSYFKKRGRLH
ncbi:MAG: DUF58 domain-containing protein [Ignavibacteria bacterium]